MYDNTEEMTEAEALAFINKQQRAARYEIKKEERETGLNYKSLKTE